MLQKIADAELDCDKNTQDQARAILNKMKTFNFIFSLATMRFVMRPCKVLVVQLQEEGLNLLDALGLVSFTTKALEKVRNEDGVKKEIEAAVAIAKQFGIGPEEEFQQHHQRKLIPRKIDKNRDNEAVLSLEGYYAKEIFLFLTKSLQIARNTGETFWRKLNHLQF